MDLLHVYIIEAHAADEWAMEVKPGVTYTQPKKLEDRLRIANEFARDLDIEDRMVVDSMSNTADMGYEARPERLYVIDNGMIVWRSGLGPFQYDVDGLRVFLSEHKPSQL